MIEISLLLFLAIILLIAGEIKDLDGLNLLSALFWIIGGAYALSLIATSNFYLYIGWPSILVGIVVAAFTIVEGITERRKKQAEYVIAHKPKTFEQQLQEDDVKRHEAKLARREHRKQIEEDRFERRQRRAEANL